MAAMVNLCISVPINNDPGGICRMNINRVMPQINARMQARFMFISLPTRIQDTYLALTELSLGI